MRFFILTLTIFLQQSLANRDVVDTRYCFFRQLGNVPGDIWVTKMKRSFTGRNVEPTLEKFKDGSTRRLLRFNSPPLQLIGNCWAMAMTDGSVHGIRAKGDKNPTDFSTKNLTLTVWARTVIEARKLEDLVDGATSKFETGHSIHSKDLQVAMQRTGFIPRDLEKTVPSLNRANLVLIEFKANQLIKDHSKGKISFVTLQADLLELFNQPKSDLKNGFSYRGVQYQNAQDFSAQNIGDKLKLNYIYDSEIGDLTLNHGRENKAIQVQESRTSARMFGSNYQWGKISDKHSFTAAAKSAIDQGKVVYLATTINTRILPNRSGFTVMKPTPKNDLGPRPDSDSGHAMIVVGDKRDKEGNVTHFYVRNSWGQIRGLTEPLIEMPVTEFERRTSGLGVFDHFEGF